VTVSSISARAVQFTRSFVVLPGYREPFLGAQVTEFLEVAFVGRFVGRQQREQAPALCRLFAAERYSVIDEVPITKTLEQAGAAKLLKMLRDTWLALRHNLSQLGHRALAADTERQQTQPYRIGKRFEVSDQLFGAVFHNL
jgi:hypothetical protein